MPSGLLRPVLAKKDLSIETANFIASEFNVSLTAASIRLCLEKADESYLVLSRNGNVEWASRYSDRQGYGSNEINALAINRVPGIFAKNRKRHRSSKP